MPDRIYCNYTRVYPKRARLPEERRAEIVCASSFAFRSSTIDADFGHSRRSWEIEMTNKMRSQPVYVFNRLWSDRARNEIRSVAKAHLLDVSQSSVLPFAAAALAIVIFVFDTVTDLEIAVAVFYVAVVLMSVSFTQKRGVVLVAATCVTLTLVSYFLTQKGSLRAGLINCLISLSAIGATTYLALKIEAARAAMHEARAQLTHIARVTSLGELTASIAHEVNQPLGAIVTNANACLRWLSGERPNLEEVKQGIDEIVSDANRASKVIGRIRALTKRAPPRKDWLDINESILEIVSLTRNEIRRNHISLRTELSDRLPLVLGDRIQLQQVILNLVINAIEAVDPVGQGPREVMISSIKDPANGVNVSVLDSGTGLNPGKLDHVFDAFHTTKPEGLGMGLAISRSIVEDHGGRIWARRNTPRGAVIQFTLPTVRDEA
jgi:C4-dicarboxylate-specific signal transduction histidine kinase